MPMKVVVCFDQVRVTVPCGDGNGPVSDLITKAVHRYKRATGKGPDHWVEVTSLKTITGGGILDPDDQLNDVVDDREQLIADFDEANRSRDHVHNGGDGASSTGTISPDVFRGADDVLSTTTTSSHHHTYSSSGSSNNNTDVVVTSRDLSLGSNLRVRRGSDPGLHLAEDAPKELVVRPPPFGERPAITRRESVRESDEPRSESSDDEKRMKMAAYGSLDRKRLGNRFVRDALRASLSNQRDVSRWIESREQKEKMAIEQNQDSKDGKITNSEDGFVVCLHIDGGPLGIHAVPALDENGGDLGLLVQSVEPGRPVYQDGRIHPNDIIVEINSTSLRNVPFVRAQEMFRSAMQSNEIHLKIIKQSDASSPPPPLPQHSTSKSRRPAPPPPILPKPRSHTPVKPSPLTFPSQSKGGSSSSSLISAPSRTAHSDGQNSVKDQSINGAQSQPNPIDSFQSIHRRGGSSIHSSSSSSSSVQNGADARSTASSQSTAGAPVIRPGPPIRPAKKVPPPAIPSRNPKTQLSSSISPETPVNLNALTNTRRIGNKIHIMLQKGPLGLGFSVTSRDNPTSGDCPIYIRNILPKGAAVQDGQLKAGDRLLEVNSQEMTGRSQAEAVSLLRLIAEGSMVELVVSRQEEVEERFKMPRPLDAGGKAAATIEEDESGTTTTEVVKIEERVVDDQFVVTVPDVTISSQPVHASTDLDSPPGGFAQEKFTFHIPLNETGCAGLGVSVKGKTQSTDNAGNIRDLGIFIKTVLQGGAASKDGRLQVNDQLLEVNDVNLVGMPNSLAMEALRTAMMDNALGQGHINLTIARYPWEVTPMSSFEDSPNTSQGEIFPPTQIIASKDNNGIIAPSGGNHHFHQRSSSASEMASSPHQMSPISDGQEALSPILPPRSKRVSALRDKFNDLGNALRNESYTRATVDNLSDNDGAVVSPLTSPIRQKDQNAMRPPPRLPSDAEYSEKDVYALPNKVKRPHSTIGFLHGDQVDSSYFGGDGDALRHAHGDPRKEESDLSPEGDIILPFSREGFGRQSMSEKRKGHLDPRSTEVYKQAKANKENKGGYYNRRVRSFHVTGSHEAHGASRGPKGQERAPEPSSPPRTMHSSTYHPQPNHEPPHQTNVKRASSLEDLANISATQINRGPVPPPKVRQSQDPSPSQQMNQFGRARACNESFRAAVDRSYDVMDPSLMDTLEEESLESAAFPQEPSFSGRSSVSSENTTEDNNSLKRSKVKDKEKKGGLLKGFLRFGKGRKSSEEAMRRSRSEDRSANQSRKEGRRMDYSGERQTNNRVVNDRWAQTISSNPTGPELGFYPVAEFDKERRRRASQQENDRIEDEYAYLRAQHLAEQRLRSQSVDPSMSREFGERTSPFQPYVPPKAQQSTQSLGRNNADARHFHNTSTLPSNKKFSHESPAINPLPNHNSRPQQDGKSNVAKAVLSRAEKIQQLRSMYQQRHRQRQGVYPLDDTEEQYERQIQEFEQSHNMMLAVHLADNSAHVPHSYDRNRQEGQPMNKAINMNDPSTSAMAYSQQPHNPSYGGYRQTGSFPQSRNNSAERVPINNHHHEISYFQQRHPPHQQQRQQHHHHHPHPQQQQHPHSYPHHETFYHSDHEEMTSFSQSLDAQPQSYPSMPVHASDHETHHFFHSNTQFHPSQGPQYGHYKTNSAHSDSAKV